MMYERLPVCSGSGTQVLRDNRHFAGISQRDESRIHATRASSGEKNFAQLARDKLIGPLSKSLFRTIQVSATVR
jgi:hypothetical protein